MGGFLVEDPEFSIVFRKVEKIFDQINQAPQTTHNNRLASSFLKDIDQADFFERLGIGNFPELADLDNTVQNLRVRFSKGDRTSDQSGQLELKINLLFEFNGKSLQRSKTILISGFLKSTKTKEEQDRLEAQMAKDYFEKTFSHKTRLTGQLASEAKLNFVSSRSSDLNALGLEKLPKWLTSGTPELNLVFPHLMMSKELWNF
ncbi:lipoprotein 17-related variable surface protein [Mycoplasma sp. ATU-Cv-508]|uniref:lipoprotein 17-related variable surface protein n=1 Tax=Mycoplasma sp. ATU-Cv-508 TaxID=2048001 RepID=UPI001374F49B